MTRTPLVLEHVASNSGGLSHVGGVDDDNLVRGGALYIRLKPAQLNAGKEAHEMFEVFAYGPLFPPPKRWVTDVPLSHEKLFAHVEECRGEWQKALVDYAEVKKGLFKKAKTFPFQEGWDFQGRPELLRKCGGRLAKAGERLFFFIFEDNDDPVLREIGRRLRKATVEGGMVFTITSDSFFVPWGMLYTHPESGKGLSSDGSNFMKEGFWGYRHIIEHNTIDIELETGIKPDYDGLIAASMNFDENIDTQLGVSCVIEQQELFERLKRLKVISHTERRQKDELQRALEGEDFADRILYFYCHGEGASGTDGPSLKSANIRLTDRQPITGSDIAFWLRSRRELRTRPLVFINACQGGQMTTLFYQTIASEFLRQKAVGLVGCQIDIPAPFAAEYAKRLLSEFINSQRPMPEKVRLGPLLNELTKEFINVHHNPLGLVYSLYRGMDCYIDRKGMGPRT